MTSDYMRTDYWKRRMHMPGIACEDSAPAYPDDDAEDDVLRDVMDRYALVDGGAALIPDKDSDTEAPF